jgi:hypothetical protein
LGWVLGGGGVGVVLSGISCSGTEYSYELLKSHQCEIMVSCVANRVKENLMKRRTKRAMLVVAAVLLVLFATIWVFSYHTSEFKGGLSIQDSGFLSYPRYHAQLGQFALWEPGEHQFTLRGLPPGPLGLSLEVQNATDADRAELMSLLTLVSVSITDSSGKEVCNSSGRLWDPGTRGGSNWVLASNSSGAYLWQPRCQDLPISRLKTYIVKCVVADVDARSQHWTIAPVLAGGGNELP